MVKGMNPMEKSFLETVESYFVTRVGRGLALSGMDIHRLRQWEDRSIPPEVVVRGLEQALEHWSKDEPPRSLAFATRHVERAIEDHRKAFPGGASEAPSWTRPVVHLDTHTLRAALARLTRRNLCSRARMALHAGHRTLRSIERDRRTLTALSAWNAVRESVIAALDGSLTTEERARLVASALPRASRGLGGVFLSGLDTMSPEAAEAHRKARFAKLLLEKFELAPLLRTPRVSVHHGAL